MKFDLLEIGDLNAAWQLSVDQSWNQTAADWRRLIVLQPTGCFAARIEQRLVGTVTTITYGTALAWIGMMIVHADFRRRGIGAALMRLALDSLQDSGVVDIMLDATPEGRPLYESLGFQIESEFERWGGVAAPRPNESDCTSNGGTLEQLAAIDCVVYGVDRSRLLRLLVDECVGGPIVVQSHAAGPHGFALARQGRTAIYIGPLVAETGHASQDLLDGMLTQLAGETVCLDICTTGPLAASALAARGLSKQRQLTRMRFGNNVDLATGRVVCASAGPELG